MNEEGIKVSVRPLLVLTCLKKFSFQWLIEVQTLNVTSCSTIFGATPVYRVKRSYWFLSSRCTDYSGIQNTMLFMTYKLFLIIFSNSKKAIMPPRGGLYLRTAGCEANALPLTTSDAVIKTLVGSKMVSF